MLTTNPAKDAEQHDRVYRLIYKYLGQSWFLAPSASLVPLMRSIATSLEEERARTDRLPAVAKRALSYAAADTARIRLPAHAYASETTLVSNLKRLLSDCTVTLHDSPERRILRVEMKELLSRAVRPAAPAARTWDLQELLAAVEERTPGLIARAPLGARSKPIVPAPMPVVHNLAAHSNATLAACGA